MTHTCVPLARLIHTQPFAGGANSEKFVSRIHSVPQPKQPSVERGAPRAPLVPRARALQEARRDIREPATSRTTSQRYEVQFLQALQHARHLGVVHVSPVSQTMSPTTSVISSPISRSARLAPANATKGVALLRPEASPRTVSRCRLRFPRAGGDRPTERETEFAHPTRSQRHHVCDAADALRQTETGARARRAR